MKIAEAASRVITLAEAIRNYWDNELPKRHPNYPFVDPDTDSGPPPAEAKQLRQFLARLSDETVFKLALILYLGRGDFDTNDLPREYQALRNHFDDSSAVISQLVETVPLGEYLREGMTILTTQRIDLDKMDLTTARAGK